MSNSEVLDLYRITKKHLKDLCRKHKLYETPHLNEQLYLHFQGFQSIENLEEYTGLKCLWLESNAISEIQGLDCQTELKCLFLQNNLIRKIENLQCCSLLNTLNLSSNHITKIENCGIDILPELSTLDISKNYLQNSDAIKELINCKNLWSVDLSNNRIDDILVVKIFAKMPELRVLVLQGNPVVSKIPQYRKTLILECKNLTFLDSRPVFPKDRASAEAWKRGGYEEERKELKRWSRLDRKTIRDSVNATLRIRQKYGAGDIQLLESSDDENDEKEKNEIKKIPKDGTSSGDLEIVGVSKGFSDSSENSTNSCDDFSEQEQKKFKRNEQGSTNISKTFEKEENIEDTSNNNKTYDFEEQVLSEDVSHMNEKSSEKNIDDVKPNAFNQEYNIENKCVQESCEDIKLEGTTTDLEVYSKCEKPKSASNDYDSSETEEDVDIRSEDQKFLEKSIETSKENNSSILSLSTSDFIEQNETTESFTPSSSSESSFTKYGYSNKINNSSKLEIETDVVCSIEDQKLPHKSLETRKEILPQSVENMKGNDLSFLFSSTLDLSEQNKSTESLPEFSFTNHSSSYSTKKSDAHESTESNNETNSSSSYFSEQNESTKSLSPSSSCDSSFTNILFSNTKDMSCKLKMEEAVVCRSEEQKLLQKSTETNKESDSSFLSLSISDFSEQNESSSSSSESNSEHSSGRGSKTLREVEDKIVLDEECKLELFEDIKKDEQEIYFEKSGVSSEFQKFKSKETYRKNNTENNSKLEIEEEYKFINEDQKLHQELKETYENICDETVLKNNKEVSEKLNICEPEHISETSSCIQVENESPITNSNIDEINLFNRNANSSSVIPRILTEIKAFETTQPLNDPGTKLRKIFKVILTDDEDSDTSIDFSTGISTHKTETQQLSSNLPSFEDHNTENFVANEVKIADRSNDSIWQDMQRHLEDTNASRWLEKLLASEDTKENSAPQRLIEEIDDDDSCLALYDSTEETFASTWLGEHSYDDELPQPSEEFESIKAVKKHAFLDQINQNPNKDTTKISVRSNNSEEGGEEISSMSRNYFLDKESKNRTEKIQNSIVFNEDNTNKLGYEIKRSQKNNSTINFANPKENEFLIKEQSSAKIDLRQQVKSDLLTEGNDQKPGSILISKEISKISTEDDLLENHSSSSSWWERRLAVARIEVSKLDPTEKQDGIEDIEKVSEMLQSVEEIKVSEQGEKDISKGSTLEHQTDASNFLEGILEEIIQIEDEASLTSAKINSQNYSEQDAKVSSGNHNFEKSSNTIENEDLPSLEEYDSSSSSEESPLAERSSLSTLRETVNTFNEFVEKILSRDLPKSQLCKELIGNPLTTTFSTQTADQINRQVEELKQQKREQLSNSLDCVYAQRENYDDTLEVVNGRLMVVKRSTGALEELPPPPPSSQSQSQPTESTKYISCGVSTTSTSCNDNDDDECGTALSEDYHHHNNNDDDDDEEDENDIEQHASDTKIKSIPYTCSMSDMNYCANESVSLSSAGSSTKIEKDEEDNNPYHHHHHSDEVDDSQQRASAGTGRLYNEIDSELVPESSSKWLKREEVLASAAPSSSPPADYKQSSKRVTEGRLAAARAAGGTQTKSEFQVELDDAIQSFMDFGENAAALEDIALSFGNPNDNQEKKEVV